jgi:hypothetical protein
LSARKDGHCLCAGTGDTSLSSCANRPHQLAREIPQGLYLLPSRYGQKPKTMAGQTAN